MGLFDVFRKPKAEVKPKPKPASPGPLLTALIQRFGLQMKPCPDRSMMGDWWEGRHEGRVLGFRALGKWLALYLGAPAEITEIYLVRATPQDGADLEATKRDIARIAGPEGAALAAAFRLGATPPEALFDIPELRLPALRDGVPRLSAAVLDVQIYDTWQGLELKLGPGATVQTVEADLAIAHEVLTAVAARA